MERWKSCKKNKSHTMGIEYELQLVNLKTFNLTNKAKQFLKHLSTIKHPGRIKPEITLSMIEINSSVHSSYLSLLDELHILKDILVIEAEKLSIGVCGGGTHPFQMWQEQIIYPTKGFMEDFKMYGYLAKQFSVFGEHIHIGCINGDEMLYLCHAITPFLPHLIALSGSSPFYQGLDTNFDCSRLTVSSGLPFSGTIPWLSNWDEFEDYMHKVVKLKIIRTIKDLFWDVRPQPKFGTIEIRVCDSPLDIEKAATLAAYTQLLVQHILKNKRGLKPTIYFPYLFNRFNAARFGLGSTYIEPNTRKRIPLRDHILNTCDLLLPYAKKINCESVLDHIEKIAQRTNNDATWIRQTFHKNHSLAKTVKAQVERFTKDPSLVSTPL